MGLTGAQLAACFMVSTAACSGALTPEFVFTDAPFASAHASTIVQLRDGSLMTAWFGGSAEGKPDVAIWYSRRMSGHWTAPMELVREPNIACYNPVLFYNREGRLWFYYKFGPHPSGWSAGRRWSSDDGKTWSAVEHLPAGLYGPIRAKPLVLPDGTIVSGTSVESYHNWACWIERSTDGGIRWTKIGPITLEPPPQTGGIIQPSVVSLGGKRLVFYARSTAQTGRICISESSDAGLTWSPARPLDLPNPNSGIDAVALRDGRVVLVYNNSTHDRTPLNVAVSTDGEKFRIFETLEDGPGEYSYPAIIQGKDGDLHITYTWKRQRIRYVRIPLKDVR
jgi:predicted neuraminidase